MQTMCCYRFRGHIQTILKKINVIVTLTLPPPPPPPLSVMHYTLVIYL